MMRFLKSLTFGVAFVLVLNNVNAVSLTREDISIGQIFPPEIFATIGEDIYLKITQPLDGQTECSFRPPGRTNDVIVKANLMEAGGRITKWGDVPCGIHIHNATLAENGGWRLTSTNGPNMARGLTWIEIRDFKKPANIKLNSPLDIPTPSDTKYCYVVRPSQPKTEFPDHSKCSFPHLMEELDANGVWNVVTAIEGQTEEVIYEVNVESKVEELVTSVEFNETTSQLTMTCNLANSKKILEFCRFLRLDDDVGFNMEEGHGTDKYSYYGKSFMKGQCGIVIKNVEENDRSTWKCYLGVTELGMQKTIGALLDASDLPKKFEEEIESEDVFGIHDSVVKILCKNKLSADYCWFQHPSGKRISVSEDKPTHPDDEYRYSGTGINLGECGLEIMKASTSDSGQWSCHMGTTGTAAVEASKEINVRVTGSHLVAPSVLQEGIGGSTLSLECSSVPANVPLNYCRFVLPDGTGFSLNEETTSANALMGNYYFNPNRKMKHGHCSLIVKKATVHHTGEWTCAGRLAGRDMEHYDDFRVHVFDNTASVAAIGGMIFATLFVIGGLVVVAFMTYNKRYRSVARSSVSSVTSQSNIPVHLETIDSPVWRESDDVREWPRLSYTGGNLQVNIPPPQNQQSPSTSN